MKKYCVELVNGKVVKQVQETDNPSVALNKWLLWKCRGKGSVSISCGSVEDCLLLYRDFVDKGIDYFNKYWKEKGLKLSFTSIEWGCLDYLVGLNKVSLSKKNTKGYYYVRLFDN